MKKTLPIRITCLSIALSSFLILKNSMAEEQLTSSTSAILVKGAVVVSENNIDKSESEPNSLQKRINELTQDGKGFQEHQLFNSVSRNSINVKQSAVEEFDKKAKESQASFMTLNQQTLSSLYNNPEETLTISLPFKGSKSSSLTSAKRSDIKVQLFRNKLYTDNAEFVEKTAPEDNGKQLDRNLLDLGVHYHGVISGEQDSIVAISLFKNSIEGRIHSHKMGDLNLGSLRFEGNKSAQKHHTIFKVNESDENNAIHQCGSTSVADLKRSGFDYSKDIFNLQNQNGELHDAKALNDYYFTTKTVLSGYLTNSIGVNNLSSWVSAVLNQAAAVYKVDGVNLYSEGWSYYTNSSVYDSASGADLIRQFNYYDGASVANSDVGIVLTGPGSANSGGLAYDIGGVCNSNTLNRLSMAKVNKSWSYFPYYSWTVDVYVHEIGHTLGSRHTHACAWNGNNTAIDGCAGFTEGSCTTPGLPASGQGTVMSYCHSSVGKNPALGFGSQPGATVRNYVYYCASR